MHGQHRGLVDGEEVLVLEQYGNVDGRLSVVPRGAPQKNPLFRLNPVVRFEPATIGAVSARPHDCLCACPARAVKLAMYEYVQPLTRGFRGDPKNGYDGALG